MTSPPPESTPSDTGTGTGAEPGWPAADTEPATDRQLAALDQRLNLRLRALETEQFQVSNEVSLIKNAVEMANNGLDTLEEGLAAISYQFSALSASIQPDSTASLPEDADAEANVPEPAGADRPPDGAADDPGVQRPTMRVLHAWVSEHIAPLVRKTTTTGEGGGIRWCRQWWLHHDAVERFTALHLAHGELSDSQEPSWLSAYLRDHLDPHLSTLTSPYGPFHACTPNRHSDTVTALGHHDHVEDTTGRTS